MRGNTHEIMMQWKNCCTDANYLIKPVAVEPRSWKTWKTTD